MWRELIDGIRQQHAFIDLFTKSWCMEYVSGGGRIHCARGCSGCCNLVVNATLTEAVALAKVVNDEQSAAVEKYVTRLRDAMAGISEMKEYLLFHRREMGCCPFLDRDGACGVYSGRPLSCRALLSTRESRWCAADFSALSADEKQSFVMGLDRNVVSFPMHYVAATQESGQELEAAACRRMQERFGFSLYGNMPVLVHLVREHSLDEACGAGLDEALACIAGAGLDLPLLINVEAL